MNLKRSVTRGSEWKVDYPMLLVKVVTWIPLFLLSMLINVLSLVLAPFIAYISLGNSGTKQVPAYLAWFMTHDNTIDGDEGHLARWPGDTKWIRFKRRVAWLWRNKGYTFDYDVCGEKIKHDIMSYGDTGTTDHGQAGWLFQFDSEYTWEFYLIYRYPFKQDKCLRIRFGWKIDEGKEDDTKAMLATSIGIWKTFGSPKD